jgi:hypothetical protein
MAQLYHRFGVHVFEKLDRVAGTTNVTTCTDVYLNVCCHKLLHAPSKFI